MKIRALLVPFLAALLCVTLASGCGEEKYTGPVEVAEAELASTLTDTFAAGPQAAADMARDALAQFDKEKFTEATAIVQALCARQDISAEQRNVASRCLMTMNKVMRRVVEEKGDRKMEQYLRNRSANK